MTEQYGLPDDDEQPVIELTAVETVDALFVANMYGRACAQVGQEPPDSPFAAVIQFCKVLVLASAKHDPALKL